MSFLRSKVVLHLPLLLTAAILLVSFLPRIRTNERLRWSFWIACVAFLVWQLGLRARIASTGRKLQLKFAPVTAHWIQGAIQITIFAYWGSYWDEVYRNLPLFVGQLLFAYTFDMLLTWSRRRTWNFGFGQFPIVLSTNLFLLFRDDWFYYQFVMLMVGGLAKEFIRWEKDGRRTHVFNPSGFGLSVVSICLIAFGGSDLTWGEEIATTIGYPTHIFLAIFLLGFLVQTLFSVTLMTLSAAAALFTCSWMYTAATGVYYFRDANIPVAVFLGLHFLVTDPATSPRTFLGRMVFGFLYGLGAFGLYGLLDHLGAPTFYDKLLCVPLLNLSIRAIDRVVLSRFSGKLGLLAFGLHAKTKVLNRIHMGIWATVFGAMLATGWLGPNHEGRTITFWQKACEKDLRNGCKNLLSLLGNACEGGSGVACNELGTILMEGKITTHDAALATEHFGRSCKLGHDEGCKNLMIEVLFRRGGRGYEDNTGTAYVRLSEICREGDALSCYLIGYANANGFIVARNESRALDFYLRACELDYAPACAELGKMYLQGRGTDVNVALAIESLEKACEGHHGPSCRVAGFTYLRGSGIGQDQERAVSLLRMACSLEDRQACVWLEVNHE